MRCSFCPVLLLVEHLDCSIFPLLWNLFPRPNVNDDIERALSQERIAVKSDLEQLDGNSNRSNSILVCQRANGIYRPLLRGLCTQRRVYEPLVEGFDNVWVELR